MSYNTDENILFISKQAYSREAILWSHQAHPNLLPFYGIYHLDDEHGRICLVSPWMDNGDINAYLTEKPHVNRLLLVQHLSLVLFSDLLIK